MVIVIIIVMIIIIVVIIMIIIENHRGGLKAPEIKANQCKYDATQSAPL